MITSWRKWARRIADEVKDILQDAEVYVIGSVVRGDYTGGSDVDILIISSQASQRARERAKLKVIIEEKLGLPYYHPFELDMLRHEEAEVYLRRAKE
ncbi:MAG: DNA polymerase subunit beta [Thermoprotei archaeon]|nr:MAG: DNA polymerase subunit beta [Thermoprotei archaeon]